LDHRLDEWFSYLQMVLEPWAFGPASQLSRLDAARFELGVFRHFCPRLSDLEQYARAIQDITARYNHGFCSIVEESASLFTLEGRHVEMQLAALESAATRACEALSHELDGRRVEYLEAHSVDFCNELAMRKVFTAISCSRDGSV
jgi:hypothetical protein